MRSEWFDFNFFGDYWAFVCFVGSCAEGALLLLFSFVVTLLGLSLWACVGSSSVSFCSRGWGVVGVAGRGVEGMKVGWGGGVGAVHGVGARVDVRGVRCVSRLFGDLVARSLSLF